MSEHHPELNPAPQPHASEQGAADQVRDHYDAVLTRIGDFAHDRSTGPAVPDDLWEIRAMAYEATGTAPHAPAPVPPLQGAEAVPPVLSVLADWEEKNGTLAAILPSEWQELHEMVTSAAIIQSPRQALFALAKLAAPGQAAPTEPLITVESSLRFRLDGAQQKIAHLEEENRELRGRLPSKDLSFMFDEPATVAADTLTDELPGMWKQSDIAGGETDCQPVAAGSDARRAFEVWAKPILGDNPTWRESGDCELAWQAWQAASPARAAEPVAAPAPVPVEQAMDEAVATGDGTLHGAIDYWQERALKAEAAVGEQEKATEGADKERCAVNPISSRVCEHGTHGCVVRHGVNQ